MAAISPRLDARATLLMTQKINPYKKATEPPEGITMPIEPPKQIHVLNYHVSVCFEDYCL